MAEKGTGSDKKRGRIKTLARNTVLFAVLLSILYLMTVQTLHYVRLKMIVTQALGRGDLVKTYNSEGIVIRSETVIAAPTDGELVMLVKEGARVRAGDSVAEIKTAGADPGIPAVSVPVRSPGTGVVSLQVDGLEGVLKPGQTDKFDAWKLPWDKLKNEGESGSRGIKCVKGQPVLKIIDNLTPLVICIRCPGGLPPGIGKKGGLVSMLWEGREIDCRTVDAGNYDGGSQLVVRALDYPEEFLTLRKIDVQLVGDRAVGFIVPTKALVDRNGSQGLYITDRDDVKWVPVKVEGTVDDRSAVTGGKLVSGGRYVVNPRWLSFAVN